MNNEQNSQIAEQSDPRNSALFQTQFETPLGPRVLASQPPAHARWGLHRPPPESPFEHARAAWRQLLTTAAGATVGPRGGARWLLPRLRDDRPEDALLLFSPRTLPGSEVPAAPSRPDPGTAWRP